MHPIHPLSIGTALFNITTQTVGLTEPSFPILISELSLHDPPSISSGHEDWFYVEVAVDNVARTTSAVSKRKLPWKETFTFNARRSSRVTLQVFAKRIHCRDTYVGSLQGTLDAFLGSSGEAVLSSPSSNDGHQAAWKTRLSFSVKRVGEKENSIDAAFPNIVTDAPRLAEPTFPIQINGLNLCDPPSISLGHEDRFYVEVVVDNVSRTTSTVPKHKLPWKETLDFDARQSSVVTLRVFAERKLHQDTYVGSVQGRLDAFLGSCEKALLPPPHSNNDPHAAWKTKMSLSVKRVVDATQSGSPSVASELPTKETSLLITEDHLPKEISRKYKGAECDELETNGQKTDVCHSSHEARDFTTSFPAIIALFPDDNQRQEIQQILDSANNFRPLLDKIDLFLTITNALGDIHPYVRAGAVILTGVIKVFTAQLFLKENVKNLFDAMVDAHSFLTEADPLARINSHREIILALLEHTEKCLRFLQDIAKDDVGFLKQLWAMNKFQEYTQKFQQLRAALQERANILTAVTVLRVHDEVQGIRKDLNVLATRAAELFPNRQVIVTSRPKDIVRALEDKPHVVTQTFEDPTLPDNDSGISFSPIRTCGRCSPSSVDSVL
ncbi:hypothetical protein EDC04DRAFT_498700 [Pisolithus marmoratus]|nr:hypothetical protein EDC04DRAFT_498700 [Pisolithus marmoratus]